MAEQRVGDKDEKSDGQNDFMIHPKGWFRRTWDSTIVLLILYCAFEVPFSVAFALEAEGLEQVLDWLVDCFFITDVMFNFFTGYYNERGVLIMDQAQVASKYFKTWLGIDLLSSLPFDIMFHADSLGQRGGTEGNLWKLHTLLRLIKVTRIMRLQRIFTRMQMVFALKFTMITVIKILLAFLYYIHWFACGFVYLARVEGQGDVIDGEYVHQHGHLQGVFGGVFEEDLVHEYVLSVYHVMMVMLTIDMVYRPENITERVFTLVFGGFGTGLLVYGSTVVVNMAMLMQAPEQTLFFKLDAVNSLVQTARLSTQTAWSITNFYSHVQAPFMSTDMRQVLRDLPHKLREDTLVEIYEHVTAAGPFLRMMDRRILRKVLSALVHRIYSPGEVVAAAGDPATAFHVVVRGMLWRQRDRMQDAPEDLGDTLQVGDTVGDLALANLERPEARRSQLYTVKSMDFADCPMLTRAAACRLLDDLGPQLGDIWRDTAHERAMSAAGAAPELARPGPISPYQERASVDGSECDSEFGAYGPSPRGQWRNSEEQPLEGQELGWMDRAAERPGDRSGSRAGPDGEAMQRRLAAMERELEEERRQRRSLQQELQRCQRALSQQAGPPSQDPTLGTVHLAPPLSPEGRF